MRVRILHSDLLHSLEVLLLNLLSDIQIYILVVLRGTNPIVSAFEQLFYVLKVVSVTNIVFKQRLAFLIIMKVVWHAHVICHVYYAVHVKIIEKTGKRFLFYLRQHNRMSSFWALTYFSTSLAGFRTMVILNCSMECLRNLQQLRLCFKSADQGVDVVYLF
jgi:hypothetical protein